MNTDHWHNRGPGLAVALVAALALAGLPAAAGPVDADGRALVAVFANGVHLAPQVAYSRAVLTVSGTGGTHRYEFGAWERPSIGLFDPAGELLADGSYRWELDLRPTAEAATELRRAAKSGDGDGGDWSALGGSFVVAGGFIADPELVEGQALRRAQRDRASVAAPAFGRADRVAGEDGDAAVGADAFAEARVNARAARQTPAAGAALRRADRGLAADSDAAVAALGTVERGAIENDNPPSALAGAFAPQPRSDGANGRPRSDEN